MRSLLAVVAIAFFGGSLLAEEKKVTLSGDNTKITWVGTKPGGKHEGGFKKLTGMATVEGGALKSVEINIETDSIYSDNAGLTGHLKGPDFFGVKTNPKSTFKSRKIEKTDAGMTITGDLMINGKTNSVSIPAKVTVVEGSVKISGEVSIDKKDFGMTYGGGKIDDQVAIKVAVEAK